MEVHTCPECGKTFGRKSNLKAIRTFSNFFEKFAHFNTLFYDPTGK
jgi:hypothetical protein